MILTHEDLKALSGMMDEKLVGVYREIGGVKTNIKILAEKVDKLEGRIDGLEGRIDSLESRIDTLERKVDRMDERLSKVEFLQEHEIIPRLQNIEDCYISTFERYKEKSEKIDRIEEDVEVINKVVCEHNEIIKRIS